MPDRVDLLPEWAVAELRRPVDLADDFRQRVMAGVRAAARPSDGVRAGGTGTVSDTGTGADAEPARRRSTAAITARAARSEPRRGRRFVVSGAFVAVAASVAWMALTPSILSSSRARLIPVLGGGSAGSAQVLGDTVDAALRDTLRLVRFVLRAPDAARVALAGDFNGWSSSATPLMDSSGSGVWEAVVALDRDAGRYAFVVDDTQWVRAARIEPVAPASLARPAAPVGGDST